MLNKKSQIIKNKLRIALGCVAIGLFFGGFNSLAQTQTPTVTLPPGVQDVVKLAQAGMGEDVILAQVRSAGAAYNLSADQLIYLNKSGVSQNVIKALISGANSTPAVPTASASPVPAPTFANTLPPSPAVAAPPSISQPGSATAPAAPDANLDSFRSQLTPYGAWVEEPGYGLCWRPTVAAFDVNWRPYGDNGHWMYTENGWYWESDYPWGGIAFHYGRWHRDSLGWVWSPGYDWAPAWVTWRHSDGYVGWAPLPPAAIFRAGVGLEFGGHMALDVDFGLGADAFLFVGCNHFWDRDLHGFFLPHDRVDGIFRHSVVINGYRFDHGRFFVEGLGRERMAGYTHREIRVEAPMFHEVRGERFATPDRRVIHEDRRGGRDRDR